MPQHQGSALKPLHPNLKPSSVSAANSKPEAGSARRVSGTKRLSGSGPGLFKQPRRTNKFVSPMRHMDLQESSTGGKGKAQPGASNLHKSGVPHQRVKLHALEANKLEHLLASLDIPPHLYGMTEAVDFNVAAETMVASEPGVGQDGQQLGMEEFTGLLVEAGADPRLATSAWVANHFRLVVWKLAMYQAQRPQQLAGRLLTAGVILDQLRYRYEREVNQGHRPMLKKVLEQDDTASKAMVLRLVDVIRPQQGMGARLADMVLLLSDGWYTVHALPDLLLKAMVDARKLLIGDKVRICGAELVAQGQADALEACRTARLKIHFNGTHRVAAATRLGWQAWRGVYVPLPIVHREGGLMPRTLVLVQRVFPLLYCEQLPSGVPVLRSQRAQQAAERRYEQDASKMEEDVAAEVAREEALWCQKQVAKGPSSAEGMYARIAAKGDTSQEAGEGLLPHQRAQLERLMAQRSAAQQARTQELRQQAMQGFNVLPLQAKPFLQLLVSGVTHQAGIGSDAQASTPCQALIRVERPSESEQFMEGQMYLVTALAPGKKRSDRDHMAKSWGLELATTTKTTWQPFSATGEGSHSLLANFQPRQQVCLRDMGAVEIGQVFDFAGVVAFVGLGQYDGPGRRSQWIFLADGSLGTAAEAVEADDMWLFAVQLVGEEFALNFLDPAADTGAIIELRDLTFQRHDSSAKLHSAFAYDLSAISLTHAPALRSAASTGSVAKPKPAAKLSLAVAEQAAWRAEAKTVLEHFHMRIHKLVQGAGS
ncbi:hypothetical protein WJX72_003535 [[Myrmecia] bisecta]|uniref:BRCA2 OB1 domain-containing protein n=1 Tax=[Myrmecia] bisecta TaxID=41462 RepID=A0AAW1R5W3_9CHLO